MNTGMRNRGRDYLGERIHDLTLEMRLLREIALWALDADLKGRADSKLNQRRILLYLAVRVERGNLRVTFSVIDLSYDLNIEQRTVRRTLDKLEAQKFISQCYTGTVKRKYKIEYVPRNNGISAGA